MKHLFLNVHFVGGLLCNLLAIAACSQPLQDMYKERALSDPHRPILHFTAPAFWLNDPNGLVHYKGDYHLFYQYSDRPEGPDAVKYWGHARSKDLLRWEHLPLALSPSKEGADSIGIWSGSAYKHNDSVMMFYTGVFPERQFLAFQQDHNLIHWRKYEGNPIVAAPPPNTSVISFRDPTVWKDGNMWMMGIGSGISDQKGAILGYESRDLINWSYTGPLYVDENKEESYVFECPSFLPLTSNLHLLLFSGHVKNGRTGSSYMIGKYKNHRFVPHQRGVVDISSDFYAAQAFQDESGRILIFGWIKPVRSETLQQSSGWSGVISFPRQISIDKNGDVSIRPVEEMKSLRSEQFEAHNLQISSSLQALPGLHDNRGEILVRFDPIKGRRGFVNERFGLILRRSNDGQEQTRIYYDALTKKLVMDRSTSSLEERVLKNIETGDLDLKNEPLTLRIFMDRSVIEVFANDKIAGTLQVYPTNDANEMALFSEGGAVEVTSIQIWKLNK